MEASFTNTLKELTKQQRPIDLTRVGFPENLRILVLAPHPDDFDEVAVCMKYFQSLGCEFLLLVLTGASSGVLNSFIDSPTKERKESAREREQRDSLDFFGFDQNSVRFLYLPEDKDGEIALNAFSKQEIEKHYHSFRPQIVSLPYGNDTNTGHQRTFSLLTEIATGSDADLLALYHRDPKTISIRLDAYIEFDQDVANWKAEMLRFHRSQHTRNLETRNYGIDDRILEVNRDVSVELKLLEPYAEGFQFDIYLSSK